ncbi:uncharacterized protein LOC135398474 [Ornithodoros turicata]|uniref:uncharacterized protein LOC135398474 n=1 Tax=Ornithodoros turicata TaxID=34597 RepID=UPI003139D78F
MTRNIKNLLTVREYVDELVLKLQQSRDLQLALEPTVLETLDTDDCQLRNGQIHGLAKITHDKRPRLQLPTQSHTGFDVAATLLVKDITFEAAYEYTSAPLYVRGAVEGKVDVVRMELLIAGPQEMFNISTVKTFRVKEFTGVTVTKMSAGIPFQKHVAPRTTKAVRETITSAMANRATPVLQDTVARNSFPKFSTEEQPNVGLNFPLPTKQCA